VSVVVRERWRNPVVPVADPSREQKTWCLAACAILTHRNKDRIDILGGSERTDTNIDCWMKTLSESGWEIDDRTTLLASLRWIERGGHRAEFELLASFLESSEDGGVEALETEANRDPELKNRIEIVREHHANLGEKSLVGFDYSRYLSLCSWGYLVGYLTEGEAWGLMLPAARILQDTFDSWEDLGTNYLIGRRFWSLRSTQEVGASYVEAYRWLLSDPESPWLEIAWDLDLRAANAGDDGAGSAGGVPR
jgi:hypothetical protein